jgi:hypothetical protein
MRYSKKEIKFISEINRLLPNVKINSTRAGNIDGVNQAHFYIPKENVYLENSDYFYKGKLNFIHFTNLLTIESIINSKSLRLYNLNNLNDPREFSFAGNLFSPNHEYKKDARDNLFILSMCEIEILKNSTEVEFNMWRLYGNKGYGIAIELNFETSPPFNWKDYHLSSVYYGTNSKTSLSQLSKMIDHYENENPKLTIDLGQLVCFHKSKLFGLEKEIRLLFDARKKKVHGTSKYRNAENEITSPIIKLDINKSFFSEKEVKFLELPIYHQGFETVFETNPIPIPKIERIILGYQYKDNFNKVKNHLMENCSKSLGYEPIIEKSRLTKYYHDLSLIT